MRRHRIVPLAAAAALASSCGPKTEVVNTEVSDVNFAAPKAEAGMMASSPQQAIDGEPSWGEWHARSEVDPMNDRRSTVAEIDVPGTAHDIRVAARCDENSLDVSYQVDGFDKQGNNAAFEARPGRGLYNKPIEYNSIEWRPDAAEGRSSSTNEPRFPNQTYIPSYQAMEAARAQVLTFKTFFADGDEFYRVDQSQPAFRRAIAPCLDGRAAPSRAASSSREQAESAAATMSAPDVSRDAQPDQTSAVDATAARPPTD